MLRGACSAPTQSPRRVALPPHDYGLELRLRALLEGSAIEACVQVVRTSRDAMGGVWTSSCSLRVTSLGPPRELLEHGKMVGGQRQGTGS